MDQPPRHNKNSEYSTPEPSSKTGATLPYAPAHKLWAATALIAFLATLFVGAGLYVFNSLRRLPGEAVDRGAAWVRELAGVAEAFGDGSIETRFATFSTSVTPSSLFQFAALRQTEVFTQTESRTLLWGHLQLPDVIVSATAPIEYSYFVDFNERWDFHLEGRSLRVTVPPIRSNPPAIDTSELHWEVRASSVLRDEDEAIAVLKKGLTRMAKTRASEHIPLVREIGRSKLETFVEQWLAGSFPDGSDFTVKVRFADEPPADGTVPSELLVEPIFADGGPSKPEPEP